MNTPKLVVLTPVRNEAWVLQAFLEATSLWADYIIIADQMSTDGSREIAKGYPKVVLIDNDRPDMHMAATRRLLFDAAKKIKGDKILFALDADEFLSGDFVNTQDWKKILTSKPDDSFCWRWMNLKHGDATKYSTFPHYYWAVHESDTLWEGAFPDNHIHEWRLPWAPNADEGHKFLLDDFCSIHLARVNQMRQRNKERFYQVSTLSQNPNKDVIALFRQYHAEEDLNYFDVPNDAYCFYERNGVHIWDSVNLKDEGGYYTSEILKCFKKYGVVRFAFLDIWDENWVKKNGIKDPRTFCHRLLLGYLRRTNKKASSFLVRCIDKTLKWIVQRINCKW